MLFFSWNKSKEERKGKKETKTKKQKESKKERQEGKNKQKNKRDWEREIEQGAGQKGWGRKKEKHRKLTKIAFF